MRKVKTQLIDGINYLECSRCKIFKPLNTDNFYPHSSSATGFQLYCKVCISEYSKERNTKEKNRESVLKRHGITSEDYNKLYEEQKGKCGICEKYLELLHIDHCHLRNEVRGLLCNPCNNALGLFKDDVILLSSAIGYLTKFDMKYTLK